MVIKRLIVTGFYLFIAVCFCMAQGEKKPITNADVIAMLEAKLPESAIVLAIQDAVGNFDTSVQSLILLKNKGASDRIFDAMRNAKKSDVAPVIPKPQISKPRIKVDYKLFTFELVECQLFGTRLTCELLVTNNDKDRELEIRGSYYAGGKTRLIDARGNEYGATKVRLGSRNEYNEDTHSRANLVTGVPFKLTIIFDDMPQEMTTISLLDISAEGSGSVQFRSIPLTIVTPKSESSRRVYRNEFSFDFAACGKVAAVATCNFSVKNNGKEDRDLILQLGSSQVVDSDGAQHKITKGSVGTDTGKVFMGMGDASGRLAAGNTLDLTLSFDEPASITALKLVRLSFLSKLPSRGTSGADRFDVDFRDIPIGGIQQSQFMPPQDGVILVPVPVSAGSLTDELDNSSLGNASGLLYVAIPDGRGALFTQANQSRIQFPTQIPDEGTLEWRVYIDSGYAYSDYKLNYSDRSALLFTTAGPDVWHPGSTWFTLHNDGTLTLDMATTKYEGPKQTLVAKNTGFRFGRWHTVGISYGSEGQHILLDGVVVASAPRNTQRLGRGGTHDAAVNVPTIGEFVSSFWDNNRYEAGFEGTLDSFRISKKQKDWRPATSKPLATPKPMATREDAPAKNAAKGWPLFWKSFVSAVNKKDINALVKLSAPQGLFDDVGSGNTREWFKQMLPSWTSTLKKPVESGVGPIDVSEYEGKYQISRYLKGGSGIHFTFDKGRWFFSGVTEMIDDDEGSSSGGSGSIVPVKSIVTPPRADSCAFCGEWKYKEPYGDHTFLKITKEGSRYKFVTGFEYENKITWQDGVVMLRNGNNIYLNLVAGKLTGRFVSENFRATHGHAFNYRISCSLRKDASMDYWVWVEGDLEKHVAKRID